MSKPARRAATPAAIADQIATSIASQATERGTRQRALVTALALFDAQGVEATTIDQVRDAAAISVGSLYHHFRSREGLVIALYADLLEQYRTAITAELVRHSGIRALLDGFVKAHIDWAMQNPMAERFLSEHRHHRTLIDVEGRLQDDTADFIRPLLRRIKPAVDAGVLKPLPPELLLSLVIGPVQTWLRMRRSGSGKLSAESAARKLSDLIWDAVAVPTVKRKLK
jgi:AcrR family transcriptional regulator